MTSRQLVRVRGMRRSLTDDEQDTIAREIVEHLELSNWKLGPPRWSWAELVTPKGCEAVKAFDVTDEGTKARKRGLHRGVESN
jgi:hypothetical protein